jgi:tetratricopeptide (TPR) repeat protein
MSGTLLKSFILPAAIIIAGFAAVFALSDMVESQRPRLAEGYEDSDLSMNGSRLKGFALGTEGLIADWYYMRSLQYVGDKMLSQKADFIDLEDLRGLNPRLLYPFLENATDLDPHYIAAYTYGAILLPAIDPQQAIAITSKGIDKNPTAWRLYQYLGYIYWRLGRYHEAARTFQTGSEIAGAPPFMRLMAGYMESQGGSRSTARAVFRQMLADSDDEMVKVTADRRLKGLASLDQRDAIDSALADLRSKTGRCPETLSEVIPTLRQVRLPEGGEFNLDNANRLVDPTGAPYVLDRENCRSALDPQRTQLPLR